MRILTTDDTIAAVASAVGGAPRGVVRLSGLQVRDVLERCLVLSPCDRLADVRQPQAVRCELRLFALGRRLPCELYFWPTARSYTGQPAAEVHTIGSPPLLAAAVESFCSAGARPAEPGEFTLRAFLAGRLDLTQAEAVLGVIEAEDIGGLEAALAQLAGGLAVPMRALRTQLLELLADVEAGLDFVDEDIEFITATALAAGIDSARQQVTELARRMASRGEWTDEYRVVVVGPTNVGKSSLVNALAGRDVALVSIHAGTTRDFVSAALQLGSIRCVLIDTAGVARPAAGAALAAAAQDVAAEQRRTAHLELLCLDASRPLDAWARGELERPSCPTQVVVRTKCDLVGDAVPDAAALKEAVATSSRTGVGIDQLRSVIGQRLANSRVRSPVVVATAVRCRTSLERAADSLARASRLAASGEGDELVAAELRLSLEELGTVVGAVYTDDILDVIFGRFCIGK